MTRSIAEENSMLGAYNWKISRGDEAETTLQGYVKPQFAKPGHTISFHASSELDECQFFLRIYRLGWYRGAGARQVHRSKIISVGNHGIWSKQRGWQHNDKCGDSVQGMDWPRVYQLYIPDDWLPGSYIAKFETFDGRAYIHPFWISSLGNNEAKIAVLGAVITNQARNWWGGVSATQVVGGTPFKSPDLYYPVGSESLSFERPYFNSRGGDALRWEYPLVRWLEKNQIDVAYHTDLELETDSTLLNEYSHVITAGPMRYWTKNTEISLRNFVDKGGNIVHLGSEAGQHIVALENNNDYHDGQIVLQPNEQNSEIGERLENQFFSATVSGSRKNAPWAGMKFYLSTKKLLGGIQLKNKFVGGIAGLSWDRSLKMGDLKILGKSSIKHRKWTYRVANSHIRHFDSGGTIFNAGVSSWTWGLEEFGNHGNAEVNEDLQRITLGLMGLDPERKIIEFEEPFVDSEGGSGDLFTLEDFNIILQQNPRAFDALIGAGILLWEDEKFDEAHTYFERAVQIRPDSVVANYRMARNHHKLKQFEEMLPLYEFLLKERPDRIHYHIQYGDLLINLRSFEDAERTIRGVIDDYPDDSRGWSMLAHCFRRAKNLDVAEKYCQEALKIDPINRRARTEHASIAHDGGDYFAAEERWKRVLEIEPENYSAIMGIARACFKRGDHDKGRELLEGLIQHEDHKTRIWPYTELINLTFNHLKDYQYTVKICKLLFENVGTGIQNHKRLEHIPVCHLCLSLVQIGEIEEAEQIAMRYLLENPENNEYRLCLSQIHRISGNYEGALHQFNSVFQSSDLQLSKVNSSGGNQQISVEHLNHDTKKRIEGGPLVSVVMTAYKATELIEVAVNSILNQTYQNIELIIVDDASPDDTFDYITQLAKNDSRIKAIRLEENGGTYVAKNHGLLQARGQYVTFHDSDDWCHQEKLEIQVNQLRGNGDLLGITTGYIRVDENSNIIYRGKGAIRHACISLMIERESVMEQVGFFDSVRVSADSEFERRIKAVFGNDVVAHIDLPMIVASVRSESLSQGGRFMLDWTGLSGPRLEYRQRFEAYHDRVRNGAQGGFVPFPLEERVFEAPADIVW